MGGEHPGGSAAHAGSGERHARARAPRRRRQSLRRNRVFRRRPERPRREPRASVRIGRVRAQRRAGLRSRGERPREGVGETPRTPGIDAARQRVQIRTRGLERARDAECERTRGHVPRRQRRKLHRERGPPRTSSTASTAPTRRAAAIPAGSDSAWPSRARWPASTAGTSPRAAPPTRSPRFASPYR